MNADINARFLTRDEATDWDIVANHFYGIKNITEEQKELVRNAFSFLKNEFGKNYLREIDLDHPMNFHIHNYVLASRLWFVDLAANIKRLKEFPNYKSLYRRLKNPENFQKLFRFLK